MLPLKIFDRTFFKENLIEKYLKLNLWSPRAGFFPEAYNVRGEK